MKNQEIYSAFVSNGNAELTNRLIPGDENFEYPEWAEYGTLDGVPVVVYYRTTPDDQEMVEENGGDWGVVDWEERIDRITLNLTQCDRDEIADEKMEAVCAKYGIERD